MSDKKLHLESLRGIAALTVVLYHFSLGFMHFTVVRNGFIENASLMVDFFFVLSGYVIALSYSDKLSCWKELASFQRKRFLRLYPLHLIVLLLFLGLQAAKFSAAQIGIGGQADLFEPLKGLQDFGWNLLLLQNFTGEPSWNRPSWSISAEFYTYLLFAMWMMIYIRLPRIGLMLAIAIVAFSAAHIFNGSMRDATGGFVRCFMSFFIGASLVKIERHIHVVSSELLAGIVLIGTIAFVTMSAGYPNWVLMLAPLIYSLLILLLNALPTSSLLIRVLSLPFLVFLGTVSFGIYMIHELVESIGMSVFNYGFKLPLIEVESTDGRVLDLHPYAVTGIEIVMVAIVIFLAYLSYRYIERPAMRIGRRRSDKVASGTVVHAG